jgi:hypothetical protein
MSSATTLAELKSDLRENGIDYEGMTFFEGTSKVELVNDNSVLPHDVPYKGTTTNELVFMLTNMNKKIKSGALSVIRAAAYKEIQDRGLQEMVKEHFGRNYTQLNTAALVDFIEDLKGELETKAPSFEEALIDILHNNGVINAGEVDILKSLLEKPIDVTAEENSPYSDEEICDIFEHLLD